MKKIRIFVLTLLMVFMLSITVFADEMKSSSNLFLFNERINSTDEVKGDLYGFAQDINIKSIVGGDIISLGQQIDINSVAYSIIGYLLFKVNLFKDYPNGHSQKTSFN